MVVCVACGSRLGAQDVTVGDAVWASTEPAPEVLPVAKSRLRPDYPDELRKTNETGYVIVFRYLDATGKNLSMEAKGTHVPFQRAVESAFENWAMRPAQREGRAVDAEVWIPIIFNPKSAALKGADATPHLLAVTPVITPGRPLRGSTSPVVRMHLSLDATGAITDATAESDVTARALAAIKDALKTWRFAPARKNGQPVAAELEMPVLCQAPPKPEQAKTVPAKLIYSKTPDYPIAMRRFGLRGQVLIDFTVDEAGRVRNPVIFQSDNPAFDEPAIKAVREWKFEPGTRDGQPVTVRQRVPIVFQLQTFSGGENVFSLEQNGGQAGLPAALRYDTPAKIRGVLVPVYPYPQRRDGVSGKAKATLLIDPQGRVAAVKVKAADQPEFGLALRAALEGFTFDPALKDGQAVAQLVNFEQAFNEDELRDEAAERLLGVEKKHPERIVSASALDAPLKPVSRRAPRFPTGVGAEVVTGDAMIECIVDEDGRARLPRLIAASDPAFGYAAMQACAAWWFEPPKAGGKAASVRVRVPFNFNSTPPKSDKAPAAPGGEPKPPG